MCVDFSLAASSSPRTNGEESACVSSDKGLAECVLLSSRETDQSAIAYSNAAAAIITVRWLS